MRIPISGPEGRHSGNGFPICRRRWYVEKYCIVRLQRKLPAAKPVWLDIVNNPFYRLQLPTKIFSFWRKSELYRRTACHRYSILRRKLYQHWTGYGLRAKTSQRLCTSGISTLHAAQYITLAARESQVAYLHICEGATSLADGRINETTGKLVSYLVSDFIKAHEEIAE